MLGGQGISLKVTNIGDLLGFIHGAAWILTISMSNLQYCQVSVSGGTPAGCMIWSAPHLSVKPHYEKSTKKAEST